MKMPLPLLAAFLTLSLVLRSQAGTESAPASPGNDPSAATPPPDFWHQSFLTGNWGGLRDRLDAKGVDFSADYENEVFGNPYGGVRGHGTVDDGLLEATLNVDLDKLAGWKGATFRASGFWTHGDSLTQNFVGDFNVLSNIDAYDTVRLDELWLQQNFLDDKISLRVGQLTADTEFTVTPTGALFINSAFGVIPTLAFDFQSLSAPTYPLASPGVRLKVMPTDRIYLQEGVYSGDAGSQSGNPNGTRFYVNGRAGVLSISEAGYLLNQGKDDKGLPGTIKFGGWVHTSDFPTWASQAAAATIPGGPLRGNGVVYGFYGGIDQTAWRQGDPASPDKALTLFFRASGAPGEVNEIDFDIEGGFNYAGLFPGRKSDVCGIALDRTSFSHDYSNASVVQGGPAYGAESLVEGTYNLVLNPWWSLQPDLQYIFSAGGTTTAPDALVLGIRTTLAF